MADNTRAFYLLPPQLGEFGGGVASALWPEQAPGVIWGQGVPQGERAPFTILNKGSMYMSVNQTDDEPSVWLKVDEGGDDADWARVLTDIYAVDHGASAAAASEIDWDVDVTLSSGDYFAAMDLRLTMDGTAASWASGLFVKVTQPTTKAVNGYLCAGEFELQTGCANVSAWAVLVLNAINNGAQSSGTEAFIHFRDYGSNECTALFWIADSTIATTDGNELLSTVSDNWEQNVSHSIRILVGSGPTAYWIPLSNAAAA